MSELRDARLLADEVAGLRDQLAACERAAEAARRSVAAEMERAEEAESDLAALRARVGELEQEVAALHGSRTFRWTKPLRRAYAAVRHRGDA